MRNFDAIIDLADAAGADSNADKTVTKLFEGERRRILGIQLRNGAVLSKHKAPEPITVLCLDGEGTFYAGENLEESQKMKRGTLVTLAADVDHEARAEPGLHLLVTRFIGS
jgi:quercetin dioxygenase-like cupin family protein